MGPRRWSGASCSVVLIGSDRISGRWILTAQPHLPGGCQPRFGPLALVPLLHANDMRQGADRRLLRISWWHGMLLAARCAGEAECTMRTRTMRVGRPR
jgi:hypothetical protein